MDSVVSAFKEAQMVLGQAGIGFSGIFGGLVLSLLLLLTVRVIMRSIILSWLGVRNGNFVSGIAEMVVSIIVVAHGYQNPGIILAVIGWNTALFKQLML
jgi:hypothetical protein